MKKHRKTGRVISVDFSDTEVRELLPADDYSVKVKEVTEEEGKEYPYFNFNLVVTEGDYKGDTLWHICSLSPKSLWNLRATLEALGQEVPDGPMDVDLDELKNLEMGVTVEIEKVKGKNRNKVTDVFSLEEDTGKEETGKEEEEGGSKKKRTKETEEGETEKEEKTSDLDDMSLKELLTYAKENRIKLSDNAKESRSRAFKAIKAAEEE